LSAGAPHRRPWWTDAPTIAPYAAPAPIVRAPAARALPPALIRRAGGRQVEVGAEVALGREHEAQRARR